VKSGKMPAAEAGGKIADEASSSRTKNNRPLSPNLSDFVVVPDNFSFDSSGIDLSSSVFCHCGSRSQRLLLFHPPLSDLHLNTPV